MKNGKLFSRISIIDFAVILLIILVLVVAAVRMGFFSTPDEAQQQTQDVTFTTVDCRVTLRYGVYTDVLADPINVGETIYLSGKKLGVVESVSREPATIRVADQNGTSVTVERGDVYNCIVTLKATLTRKNGMLYCNKKAIASGMGDTFVSRYYSGKAYVIGVEKIQ